MSSGKGDAVNHVPGSPPSKGRQQGLAPKPRVPRARRVPINEEFAAVEAFINEYVADISATGVFIKSRDPLPVGTRVTLKFSLILDELHVVEAAGEVVRRCERPLGMGVAFRGLAPEAIKLIGRAVRERIERTPVTVTAVGAATRR